MAPDERTALLDWQRANFASLRELLLPRSQPELFLLSEILSDFGPFNAPPFNPRLDFFGRFNALPLNPWLDFFEILGLAWHVQYILADDVIAFGKTLDWPSIPVPHELGAGKNQLRPFLDLGFSMARFGRGGRAPGWTTSFEHFGIFADAHKTFRDSTARVVYGVIHQDLVRASLTDDVRLREIFNTDSDYYFAMSREAILGLITLFNHLARIVLMFSRWPTFVTEALSLYRSWRNVIPDDTLKMYSARLQSEGTGENDPSITSEARTRAAAFDVVIGLRSLEELTVLQQQEYSE